MVHPGLDWSEELDRWLEPFIEALGHRTRRRMCPAYMRRGMTGLALQVQQSLGRDPHAGDLYVFRGARGDLIKIIWHDGVGMSLYAKRLEKSRFTWPSPSDGVLAISAAQLGYMFVHAC